MTERQPGYHGRQTSLLVFAGSSLHW